MKVFIRRREREEREEREDDLGFPFNFQAGNIDVSSDVSSDVHVISNNNNNKGDWIKRISLKTKF